MLTMDAIEALVASKELKAWKAPGVINVRRAIYVTSRVEVALSRPWPIRSGEAREVVAAAQADMLDLLAMWQRGDELLAKTQLKPLTPPPPDADCVWSLRATGAPPGARTIGLIPARNIFVATSAAPRNRLGERGSAAWDAHANCAVQMAERGFGGDVLRWPPGHRFSTEHMGKVCDVH
jgi:hypothetical protein